MGGILSSGRTATAPAIAPPPPPPPPDLIQPIRSDGTYAAGAPVPIDLAHRRGLPHKGVWLFVLSADAHVLIVRRDAAMRTCPHKLSIIGEHHKPAESDAQCAARALAEELPFFASLRGVAVAPLTSETLVPPFAPFGTPAHLPPPGWFDYEYGDGRTDRCLISEFAVRLPLRAEELRARIQAGRHAQHEAVGMHFTPISSAIHLTRTKPSAFCVEPLFPTWLARSLLRLCAERAPALRAECEYEYNSTTRRPGRGEYSALGI